VQLVICIGFERPLERRIVCEVGGGRTRSRGEGGEPGVFSLSPRAGLGVVGKEECGSNLSIAGSNRLASVAERSER
jgi:hypothetical protein